MTVRSGGVAAKPKTWVDLEYHRVVTALQERTTTPLGRAAADDLGFAPTLGDVEARVVLAMEASRLLDDGEALPMRECPDVREAVERLGADGVLSPAELRGMAQILAMGQTLRRFFARHREKTRALARALSTDPSLDDAEDDIRRSFDPDGTLADHASPKLRELREEYRAARARILGKLEEVMQKYERVLQERFVTEREGRWVLPVRSDSHERFPGIVHASSASGGTLFVEPRNIVAMGNRLKMLEGDIEREELAIYTRLSRRLGEHLPSVAAAVDAIAQADLWGAVARLRSDLRLTFPTLSNEPRIDLLQAKHILLMLGEGGAEVVGSDLTIEAGRALVVSGPNAGGKTVALKTLGLAALMVRAGLPIPCGEGSVVGFFDLVLTDVGDDQSLRGNLSTFSAHIQNLAGILEDTHRGVLVLLDELCGGTDPREGEALAAGVLDSLCSRGGAVVCTTHYEGLKTLALGDPRFVNASVGFDVERLLPTFRLILNVPGRSSALSVARRYGMPSTVIDRASRFLSREDQSFEEVVARLNDERAAVELAREELGRKTREAEVAKAGYERELVALRDRGLRKATEEVEGLFASLRRAKEELQKLQESLRQKPRDKDALREIDRSIERASSYAREVKAPEAEGRPLEGAPRKGMRVFVATLGQEGEILELLGNGTARVAIGHMKLLVDESALRMSKEAAAQAGPRTYGRAPEREREREAPPQEPAPEPSTFEVPLQTRENTCDMRGMRTDEGLATANGFLDRALSLRLGAVYLVHGHGTGALRDALRRELKVSKYVAHFRPGTPSEGGDGATLVWLK